MSRFLVNMAERLGSAALRYRQPAAWAMDRPNRALILGLAGPEQSRMPGDPGGQRGRPAPLARLEAVLFLSREPVGSRRLAELAGLADGTKARTLVRSLNRGYDAEGSAFRVEEVAGGFQLMTRPKFAPWLRRLHSTPVEVRLSGPALETLAVVAYRQPVLRAEIEAVRGVQCGEVLRQLIERELVRIVGRSEELGRPLLYGTTRQFLQIFGLRHLEDLPRVDFLPITKPYLSSKDHEETDMKILLNPKALPEEQVPGVATLPGPIPTERFLVAAAASEDEDEDDDDDLDDEDDDWEEVDDEDDDLDDDEDDDWDDDEDEDWEEEEDLEDDDIGEDDDEDWDDDEDEDWEEDDEE